MLIWLFCVCFVPVLGFRGLPNLPGYLDNIVDDEPEYNTPTYLRMEKVNRNLDQLKDQSRVDPVLENIQRSVESDIKKINEQVGAVSREISRIYNSKNADRNGKIANLQTKYPKIAPAILNLIENFQQYKSD